jgi:hypothetical protein
MRRPTAKEMAEWNARLGMPEELPLIPRRRAPGAAAAEARFEGDLDAVVMGPDGLPAMDSPPPTPRSKRPGRPPGWDRDPALEQARDLLQHGGLTGIQREAWTMFAAGCSEREIARKVGRSVKWTHVNVLGPLKARAGIPARDFTPPKYRRGRKQTAA